MNGARIRHGRDEHDEQEPMPFVALAAVAAGAVPIAPSRRAGGPGASCRAR
jgi:hypothetical protein